MEKKESYFSVNSIRQRKEKLEKSECKHDYIQGEFMGYDSSSTDNEMYLFTCSKCNHSHVFYPESYFEDFLKEQKEKENKMKKFKSRKEVEDYFRPYTFMFSFMSDNTAYFKTLNSILIDGVYYDFQICFYYKDNDFFCYSTFESWFKGMQLSEVIIINTENNERKELYFERFKE